jgi:hypothetical protein
VDRRHERSEDDSIKSANVIVALLAPATGITAAIFCYRSSQVQIVPDWPRRAFGMVEPGEARAPNAGWIAGAPTAFEVGGFECEGRTLDCGVGYACSGFEYPVGALGSIDGKSRERKFVRRK